MAQNKHKTKRRIICILCASIIALYALAIPIGAVVNSSQGGFLDFNLTANSTFPLTVGFSYVTRDTSTGAGNTYVYATEIGGFGEEWNTTLYGSDTYTQNYTPMEGIEYELEGSLEYNFLEREFPEENNIVWDDGDIQSVIKRGYQTISFQNKAPSGGNVLGQQQGVVLRARDVVYNPAWLMTTEDGTSQTNEPMLPSFLSPTVENPTSEAVVLTYSWSCSIIDQEGVVHHHSNYEVFDTRENNSSRYVPIIPIDVLEQYKTQKTIVIAEYSGFLDVDYYEYVDPEPQNQLAGTWLLNSALNPANYGTVFYTSNNERDETVFGTIAGGPYAREMMCRSSQDGLYYGIRLTTSSQGYFTTDGPNSTPLSLLAGYTITFYDIVEDASRYTYTDTLLTWLQANGTKQTDDGRHLGGSNYSLAEEGTWEQVEKSGDGYLLRLQYPLYDTSGVTITDSDTYRNNMSFYGFPTIQKYIDTDGTIIVPTPPYEADYTSWLGKAVSGFLDFELFPGFSLGGMLGILISFSFIMLFLKFFAGG